MRALVLGATGGIGAALKSQLEVGGYQVTGLSRQDGLDWHHPVQAERVLAALDPGYERVICATGVLNAAPEKSLKQIDAQALADQFAVNAIGPALLLKYLPRLLPKDGPSKAAILSARVGSISDNRLGGWYGYRAAKAAVNQLVHCAAIELARSHKQACLIAYHPGTVETEFTKSYRAEKLSAEQAARHMITVLNTHGPDHSGKFYDWRGAQVPW